MHPKLLCDVYHVYIGALFGWIWGIIAFIITVGIEAGIMRKFFHLSGHRCIGYSFIVNLVSIVIGIPILSLTPHYDLNNFVIAFFVQWSHMPLLMSVPFIILTFCVTVVIEFFVMALLIRIPEYKRLRSNQTRHVVSKFWPENIDRISLFSIFGYSFVSNLASYFITFIGTMIIVISQAFL